MVVLRMPLPQPFPRALERGESSESSPLRGEGVSRPYNICGFQCGLG